MVVEPDCLQLVRVVDGEDQFVVLRVARHVYDVFLALVLMDDMMPCRLQRVTDDHGFSGLEQQKLAAARPFQEVDVAIERMQRLRASVIEGVSAEPSKVTEQVLCGCQGCHLHDAIGFRYGHESHVLVIFGHEVDNPSDIALIEEFAPSHLVQDCQELSVRRQANGRLSSFSTIQTMKLEVV